jgi:hypothetical protein
VTAWWARQGSNLPQLFEIAYDVSDRHGLAGVNTGQTRDLILTIVTARCASGRIDPDGDDQISIVLAEAVAGRRS